MHGKGSQKTARLERLKDEILAYVESNPNCTAADIVDHLANVRRMRNHGLTARKVGTSSQVPEGGRGVHAGRDHRQAALQGRVVNTAP